LLLAATMLAVAFSALAHLIVMSTRANSSAGATTYAAMLAQQKMEQLRSLAWGFDAFGLPLTDSTTARTSPPDALRRDTAGYVDYLDRSGVVLGAGSAPPPDAVYIRRWSVEPLPADPANTLVLQVIVMRRRTSDTTSNGGSRLPDEVRLLTVKTRKPA
jgi:hypothetical protein